MNKNNFICGILVVLIIIISGCQSTGKAFTFPGGEEHTVYNLVDGITTDPSDYIIVLPDGASNDLISEAASLASVLGVTNSKFESELSGDDQYLIHMIVDAGLVENTVRVFEEGGKLILDISTSDEGGLIDAASVLSNYGSYQTEFGYDCISVDGASVGACAEGIGGGELIFDVISEIDSTGNARGFKLVIGSNAMTEDNIAAIDIAGALGITVTLNDTLVTTNENLIVIGGACANTIAAELLGNPADCTEGFTEGQGRIKVFNTNDKLQVMVAGYDALQTRIAAQAIVRYAEFESELSFNEVITYGSDLDDVNIGEVREMTTIAQNVFSVDVDITPQPELNSVGHVECIPDGWIFISASDGGQLVDGCIEWTAMRPELITLMGLSDEESLSTTQTQVSYRVIQTNDNQAFSGQVITVPGCGDGPCEGTEDCNNCPADCGECPIPEPTPDESPS